jgi:cell fate (sporulation/competence/biofilm development) regulator YmcA (YheA/YmcA/DUF963 family)
MAHTEDELQKEACELNNIDKRYNLNVSVSKSKVVVMKWGMW